MKLSSERIEQTLGQVDSAVVVVPEDHPMAADLHALFGDHTFFLDEDGLEIMVPTASTQFGTEAGQVVKLAMWDDAGQTTLVPRHAESTGVIITFESAEQDRVERAGEDSFPARDPTFHRRLIREDIDE
jgi:hypothetical protein